MKMFLFALGLAIAVPGMAQAREVTFTTQLLKYRGDGAYVALYLTDAAGRYEKTLWVAGKKSKYYKHLSGWARGSGLDPAEYDGIAGASVTSGRTLKVTLDLDDALIDKGYVVRVDTAVEDKRDHRAEVAVPLTSDGSGKPVAGDGYVRSFRYDF
ncbi:DUF2271 domain-containing protein [Halopseudomonas salina]|uniref:Tat pathway signal protein n=1 Tax=Halopseudomonas salina TaxID=1323744 RepID=A0ABQ1P4J2_9GAMM|nr:DUF2271 domain-containing protein [Halopseudomonas salina]GGC90862.1 Tat pathway signal protein [Halopseudomonas salina]